MSISRHVSPSQNCGAISSCTHNRSLQELGPNPRVLPNGISDLINVGTRRLTNSRKGIDGRDTLSEHSVCGELGELRGPETDSQDTLFGDPVAVYRDKGGAGVKAGLGLEGTDEDSVGFEEVGYGCALGQEF